MLILCPSCEATYEVPEARMRPGRKVRCAQCGGHWVPLAEIADDEPEIAVAANVDVDVDAGSDQAAAPEEPEPAAPVITAMDRLAAGPTVRRGRTPLHVAWIATLLLIVAGIGAGYLCRQDVIRHWPPSLRLYGLLGLAKEGTPTAR